MVYIVIEVHIHSDVISPNVAAIEDALALADEGCGRGYTSSSSQGYGISAGSLLARQSDKRRPIFVTDVIMLLRFCIGHRPPLKQPCSVTGPWRS
jgi:hypothetical protein